MKGFGGIWRALEDAAVLWRALKGSEALWSQERSSGGFGWLWMALQGFEGLSIALN